MVKLDSINYDIKQLISKCTDLDSKIKINDKISSENQNEYKTELTILNQKIISIESNCKFKHQKNINNELETTNELENNHEVGKNIISRAANNFEKLAKNHHM